MDDPSFMKGMRSWDWSLIIVVTAFLVAVPIYGPINDFASGLTGIARQLQSTPFTLYGDAITAAALKRPTYQRILRTVDPSTAEVKVVNFGRELKDSASRTYPVWVALEPELKAACKGADNPVLVLQQALGLPPGSVGSSVINTFSVPANGLFRPCMSGGDIKATSCGFDLPDEPAPDVSLDALRGEYDHLRFVAKQMWNSYRMDFSRTDASAEDYPSSGYPFTGMGWSYNWGSTSPTHMGVSEFVTRPDAAISGAKSVTPAEFCAP